MIQEADIKARLRATVDRQLSLEDFEDWLDGASWNMHADSKRSAVQAAADALLVLSEYGLGHRNEGSVREELGLLLRRINAS
jgi:hypothetical protein